jgi:outer membrane biosynthesis protein TonB
MSAAAVPMYLGRPRPLNPGALAGGIIITVALHILIAVGAFILTHVDATVVEEKAKEELIPFTPVELIRLGEKKPPKQLPRIANPAPPQKEEKVVNLNQKPDPDKVVIKKEEPKDAVVVKKKEESAKDLLNALHNPNRPVNSDKPEGREDGVVEGNVVDDSLKSLLNTYQAQVLRAILKEWRVPQTVSEDRAKELAGKIRVKVRLSPEGNIVNYTFTARSGDLQFDNSVEETVRRFQVLTGNKRLPMPEEEGLKSLVLDRGLTLSGWRPSFNK